MARGRDHRRKSFRVDCQNLKIFQFMVMEKNERWALFDPNATTRAHGNFSGSCIERWIVARDRDHRRKAFRVAYQNLKIFQPMVMEKK